MPVIWTKYYGQGRVAYNSLGHHADIVAQKEVLPLMVRGLPLGRPGRRRRA